MKYLIIHTKYDTCIYAEKIHPIPNQEIAYYEHALKKFVCGACWVCVKQIFGRRKRKIGKSELRDFDNSNPFPVIRAEVTEEWLRDYVKGPVYSLSV